MPVVVARWSFVRVRRAAGRRGGSRTALGVFFGFAFGMGGLGAAALGRLADVIGIEAVYGLCAFLPLIGLLAAFLPDLDERR
jgi:FSR family fosmidomycin resistance protein-like MFS transporter